MNALGYALVFGTLAGFIALLALWLVAENRRSKRLRITLGLLAILTAIPVTALVAVAVSQLDDQSYYAASVQTLLDETVVALESGEPGFLHRLKTFREKQVLTYKSRSNLLENARAFRDDGQALRNKTEKTLKKPNASSSSDHAIAMSDIRALLEAGRDAKSLPARIVVRLDANAGDSDSRLKETWEFSTGQVHRVVIDESKGPVRYRREKTLAFDTNNICRQLLDGKLFKIEAAEGTGKACMFSGTAFEGGVGDRAIEILIDGESAVWVGESCVFAGLPETDALAFNALYEQLASQARAAFGALGVQAAGNATQIAVSVLDAEHGGIYVLNADGSGEQRLTKGSTDILPRWSPDGKQIAFLALREQDHELAAEHDLAFHWFLYVMDADGQNQRRVTKTPIGMIFQWSPDGSRFVFQSSCEDGNNKAKDGTVSSAIYVMKADGTKQKRLTPVEKNDGFPSWSPDGKQIAFCSNQHGNMDIFVMNADGSDVRRLTSNDANDIGPTWSPDGKQIAFASSRESGNAHVMNADGTQEPSLAVRGRPVAWSPDGQSLLLENDGQLVLSGADGRNPKELTKAGEPALDGEYSPDGKAVFYRSKVNGTWTLMSVDTERSSQKRIWSDSGKFLGFSVSPSRVSLAEDSSPLSTSNTHLTEFGNACRKSEKLYDDSRKELFALIPDFLDWKRREIEIPYSSTTNAFEVRVIFTPPDGTKAHVAVLVSGNRHLVENKKVDISEVDPAIVWGASTILTEAEYGRYDGHLLKQAAFVLEGNLADKDALDAYLESVDFKRIGKFVSSRLTRNSKWHAADRWLKRAEEACEKIEDPDAADRAFARLQAVYIQWGEIEQAEKITQRIKKREGQVKAHIAIAKHYAEAGDLERCKLELNLAKPLAVKARLTGNKLVAAYLQLAKSPALAISFMSEDPDDGSARKKLCQALARHGYLNEALDIADSLTKTNEQNEMKLNIAFAAAKAARAADTERATQNVKISYLAEQNLWGQLAEALYKKNDLEDARKYAARVSSDHTKRSNAYMRRIADNLPRNTPNVSTYVNSPDDTDLPLTIALPSEDPVVADRILESVIADAERNPVEPTEGQFGPWNQKFRLARIQVQYSLVAALYRKAGNHEQARVNMKLAEEAFQILAKEERGFGAIFALNELQGPLIHYQDAEGLRRLTEDANVPLLSWAADLVVPNMLLSGDIEAAKKLAQNTLAGKPVFPLGSVWSRLQPSDYGESTGKRSEIVSCFIESGNLDAAHEILNGSKPRDFAAAACENAGQAMVKKDRGLLMQPKWRNGIGAFQRAYLCIGAAIMAEENSNNQ